ncbi:MAG: hypothetical protein IJI68_01750 [Eggerthellaceae bacterium]|nr:hypothetical protein [Eggerthellaceae bacterium]
MRICSYCGGTVEDSVYTCPHCTSSSFQYFCPRCGEAYDGPFCPACREKDEAAHAQAQEAAAKAVAEDRANEGLAWKTALTVFLPFVGGYFLIREHVKTGFRLFGIVWCSLLALVVSESETSSAEVNVLAVLMCLGPIIAYLYQARKTLLAPGNTQGRLLIAACACVFIASIAGCLINGGVFDWLD